MEGRRAMCFLFVALAFGCCYAEQEAFVEGYSFIQLTVPDDIKALDQKEGELTGEKPSSDVDGEAESGGLKRMMNMGVGGYQIINNFMVSPKTATQRAKVTSREGCEAVCDGHRDCHSYSYRAGDKRCLWSKEALHYDSKSSYYMKLTKMDDTGAMKATGKFHKFENILYHPKGWEKMVGDQFGCETLCSRMGRCGGFSYKPYTNECFLAGEGVKYDTDYNYYERNMPPPKDLAEAKLLAGTDEVDSPTPAAAASEEAIEHANTQKLSKIMIAKAQFGISQMRQSEKEIDDESNAVAKAEDKEAETRKDMLVNKKEAQVKKQGVASIEKLNMETGEQQGLRMVDVDETKTKATKRIQTAFQEGFQKGTEKNSAAYNSRVKEIADKGRKSAEEHAGKVTKMAQTLEKAGKEKEDKETNEKEMQAKATKKEVNAKAIMKVKIDSIKKQASMDILDDSRMSKNKKKLGIIAELRDQRAVREKIQKKEKIQELADERARKHEKLMGDEKERKVKVQHESEVKEEERKAVELARKTKEQSHKEIHKKERVHKRQLKAQEMEQKLENAKKGAAELNDKHKERTVKVGKCEERRIKGQYITYAYARTTAFASAISPGTKYGADSAYNGMLRVQNGLGRLKQSAYLKFSATGNKIVDESEFLLQESTSAKKTISVAISNSVTDNAKNIALIEKGKAQYVARRRWVDRRRRWAVEPVISERRRDPLASRRRELTERRRRSMQKLEASVTKAVLKVFKFGGPAGQLKVRAINCDFERSSLSWESAAKLAVPESELRMSLENLLQTGESASLEAADSSQSGYWHQDRKAILGESNGKLPQAAPSQAGARRRTAPASLPALPVVQQAAKYVPDRRRYIDRRRRFATPADLPGAEQPNEPGPTARRRRFVGMSAGSVYAPAQSNTWLEFPLSANIVGVMRAANKMCFEITGGGASSPVILGSELSTNKPFLVLNVAGQEGARRRRCSQVVALEALQGVQPGAGRL